MPIPRAPRPSPRDRAGPCVSDALALIRDAAVDAVLVASPDQTHKELTLAAIAARKPVLCEKPLAPTPAECLEVIAAEAKLGRTAGADRLYAPLRSVLCRDESRLAWAVSAAR
jgi:predicted dehydrogenase